MIHITFIAMLMYKSSNCYF